MFWFQYIKLDICILHKLFGGSVFNRQFSQYACRSEAGVCHVCMRVSVCAHVNIHMCVHMPADQRLGIALCMCTCTRMRSYICLYTRLWMNGMTLSTGDSLSVLRQMVFSGFSPGACFAQFCHKLFFIFVCVSFVSVARAMPILSSRCVYYLVSS